MLVLTLSALLCCCCFLTMARKFVAMWHERWWLASGGDLAAPLLDEDGEEQQHEVGNRQRQCDKQVSLGLTLNTNGCLVLHPNIGTYARKRLSILPTQLSM